MAKLVEYSSQCCWVRPPCLFSIVVLIVCISLYNIASVNGFPGVSVKSAWSTQLFKTQSTPWLKPFLRDALSTYEQINEALAA